MLRLPQFRHHTPDTLEEALELLAKFHEKGEEARVVAGGTDLVPNMKHEIITPAHVISLGRVGLRDVREDNGTLHLGAMVSIDGLARSPLIQEKLPALADACSQIAGPQLRRMGTLGGNVCLDTRCLYINQSHFWRQSLGYCLKKDGTECHVVAGGRRCVAAASNDSVIPLMLYGAEVELRKHGESRVLPLEKLYVSDGVKNTVVAPDEILVEVRVPVPSKTAACAYEKLRVRKAIDFSLLNLAAIAVLDGSDKLERLEVVVSSLGARPKRITLDRKVAGKVLNDEIIATAARKAHASCRPLTNIATDPEWRRAMVPVLVKRALERVRRDLGGAAAAAA